MTRPIDLVAGKLTNARTSASGVIRAVCPYHKSPSHSRNLSVREADDGSVLLRCFSGCPAAQIVTALGLRMRDLFRPRDAFEERDLANQRRAERERFRRAPRETVKAFLERESERNREARLKRNPGDSPHLRSADVNAARARASVIFEVQLDPVARFAWEGAPHDTDASWPRLLEHARRECAYERHCANGGDPKEPPSRAIESSVTCEAEDRAAARLHALAACL